MLKNEIRQDSLFCEMRDLIEGLGYVTVDVHKSVQAKDNILVSVTIMAKEGDTGIDDCALVHRSIQSRLELLIGRDILSMEVSTPGLQRNIRDAYEFTIFTGRTCRVYSLKESSWVEGTIKDACDDSVTLENYVIEDKAQTGDVMTIEYKDIQKAKLEYKWEDAKNVRVK